MSLCTQLATFWVLLPGCAMKVGAAFPTTIWLCVYHCCCALRMSRQRGSSAQSPSHVCGDASCSAPLVCTLVCAASVCLGFCWWGFGSGSASRVSATCAHCCVWRWWGFGVRICKQVLRSLCALLCACLRLWCGFGRVCTCAQVANTTSVCLSSSCWALFVCAATALDRLPQATKQYSL
jgi:hypothetical protein